MACRAGFLEMNDAHSGSRYAKSDDERHLCRSEVRLGGIRPQSRGWSVFAGVGTVSAFHSCVGPHKNGSARLMANSCSTRSQCQKRDLLRTHFRYNMLLAMLLVWDPVPLSLLPFEFEEFPFNPGDAVEMLLQLEMVYEMILSWGFADLKHIRDEWPLDHACISTSDTATLAVEMTIWRDLLPVLFDSWCNHHDIEHFLRTCLEAGADINATLYVAISGEITAIGDHPLGHLPPSTTQCCILRLQNLGHCRTNGTS